MEYVYLIILLALAEYIVFGALVGVARGKYGVKAPAIVGHPDFERRFRVHQNTLEGLIVFIPALWIFATYVSTTIAIVIGLISIVGRAIYAVGYMRAAASRGPGALICGVSNIVLVLGGLVGVVRIVLRTL